MAITATVTPGTVPPSVTIVASGGTGIVERLEGTVATTVRGTHAAWAGGTILDYGCPQETAITYRFAGATTPAVMMPDVGVWLIPAGRPEFATPLLVTAYPTWQRPAQSWVADVPGRANPIVVSSAKRSARRGSMTVLVRDRDEQAIIDACLEVTGPMLLSSPASHYPLETRGLWVVVGDVDEEPIEGGAGWLLSLPLTRVDRPEVVAAEAGHRWVDQVGRWSAQVGTWAQQ